MIAGGTAAEAATAGSAQEEVAAAYARLASLPHRRRETMVEPMAAMGGMKPVTTDVVGNRTRQVFEIDLPRFGRMRSERIAIDDRMAVRTTAPEILALIEKTRAKATAQSVRSLLQQLLSVAAAIQTGGLSTVETIQQAVNAAATIKSAADARRVLDQAAAAFNDWQRVPPPEAADDEFGAFDPSSVPMKITALGMRQTSRGAVRQYTRRPAGDFGLAPMVVETLSLDAATGLPVAEETSMNGQVMMRVDYFDIGADITIEVPDCLR